MPKFKKKPVEITAWRLPSEVSQEAVDTLSELYDALAAGKTEFHANPRGFFIDTLEGTMHANPGDYIIRGVMGEFYPCKPDIFEATYEEIF